MHVSVKYTLFFVEHHLHNSTSGWSAKVEWSSSDQKIADLVESILGKDTEPHIASGG